MTKATHNRTRVALVDDDAEARQRLAESIRGQDWLELVAACATGTEALSVLATTYPDVLLVDLGLPDMSGLEVIRAAATQLPACDILVISMFGDEPNVLAALEAGARGYLLKGTLTRDISIDIRDLRDGGSPLSPSIARQVLKRLQLPQPARAEPGRASDEEFGLSPREIEILNAIARGFSYAEAAAMLGITVGTVHTHLKRIYRKLAVHSKTEAVFEAGRLGLLP
jgi:DNA-binding NarL/FixJ family response regulator